MIVVVECSLRKVEDINWKDFFIIISTDKKGWMLDTNCIINHHKLLTFKTARNILNNSLYTRDWHLGGNEFIPQECRNSVKNIVKRIRDFSKDCEMMAKIHYAYEAK